jgi:two-component system, LytTR family, sensor kinase
LIVEKFWKYRLDHVLFWLITIGFHIYTRASLVEYAGWGHFALEIVGRNGLLALIIYINFRFLIPGFAQRGQIPLYMLGLLACFGIYVMIMNVHDVYLGAVLGKLPQSFFKYSFYNFSIALFYMSFSLALELSKQWYFQRERIRQVELEKLNTELEYLKSQINPHFLFNSINTIYFQIDKNNAPAREALSKFSDMLRYQLYECNGKEIPIEKEIAYLRNYVELQRMRRDDNYRITFTQDERVQNFSIAPLLMITFVENAFKHVSTHTEKSNEITIQMRVIDNVFQFDVSNTSEKGTYTMENGGIGLKNVKRRLDLLYNGRHELDIEQTENKFSIRLKLRVERSNQ